MPTSIHLPPRLLQALDKRARALGVSRNSLIVKAIERDLGVESGWPPGFFEWLVDVDDEGKEAVAEMLTAIEKNRSSKGPPKL
jgi:hypothetical protein